ncbi:MAG: hypothetical protein WCZ48_01210 [Bacillota bacterium]
MRALLVYHSRTGATERLMKSIGGALEARGHRVEYHKLEAKRPMGWFASGWAALRKKEADLAEDIPKNLRMYELVLIAGPVLAGKTSAELNTFLNNMPDGIGRRFGVFATSGTGGAEGQLRSIKSRVERAGGFIIYEDTVKRQIAMDLHECGRRAEEIAEQLMRPWVW